MDDSNALDHSYRRPTPGRPLLGLTILVVEDSRFTCEAMRLLCLRSGARIRRADCLKSARRHLQVYRPSVVIIDVGLPDGSGLDLIAELAEATPRVAAILGMSGDDGIEDYVTAAGADGFLAKPVTSLAGFQSTILDLLPPERRPEGVRVIPNEQIEPDPIAYRDDMAHAADVLNAEGEDAAIDYVAQFVAGVARSAHDQILARAAEALAHSRRTGGPVAADTARVAGLVQERLQQQKAI